MKRLIAIILALTLTMTVFSGCGSSDTPEVSAPPTIPPRKLPRSSALSPTRPKRITPSLPSR